MVWDKPQHEMTDFDWRQVPGTRYDEDDRVVLPRYRLDVPMPYHSGGFHNLAADLRRLAEELDRIAKEPAHMKRKLQSSHFAISGMAAVFRDLHNQWNEELHKPGGNVRLVK